MLIIGFKIRVVLRLVNDVCIDIDGVPDTRNGDLSPCYVFKIKPGKGNTLFSINMVERGNKYRSHNLWDCTM